MVKSPQTEGILPFATDTLGTATQYHQLEPTSKQYLEGVSGDGHGGGGGPAVASSCQNIFCD
jgi:hypothetical protein